LCTKSVPIVAHIPGEPATDADGGGGGGATTAERPKEVKPLGRAKPLEVLYKLPPPPLLFTLCTKSVPIVIYISIAAMDADGGGSGGGAATEQRHRRVNPIYIYTCIYIYKYIRAYQRLGLFGGLGG